MPCRGRGRWAAAAALLWAVCVAARAEPVVYLVDSNHTQPAFEASHLGISTYRGKFTRVKGRVVLDREARAGELSITIDPQSVLTGDPTLDGVLAGEDFFSVQRYPAITYKSRRIVFEGDRPVRVEGELTMVGVTRPVTLAVHSFGCAKQPFTRREVCGADASATLRRSEFGMTRYASLLGDEVRLLIPVEAVRE